MILCKLSSFYLIYNKFKRYCCPFRNTHATYFKGRDIVCTKCLAKQDWIHIIWTAIDVKQMVTQRPGFYSHHLSGKHVTLLSIAQNMLHQVAFTRACSALGAACTVIHNPNFELQPSCADSGRILSHITDAIVVNGSQQQTVMDLAEGACIPVINSCSTALSLLRTAADIITMQEHYNTLKHLNVCWIGPPNQLCNTYLCTLPLFGANLRLHCISSEGAGGMSPIRLQDAMELCSHSVSELHQLDSMEEAVYRTHVVVTAQHSESSNKITLKLLKEAHLNWSFFHSMPRSQSEVSDEVFYSKNNLTWQSTENLLYVAMALLLTSLSDYTPKTSMPSFEG